MKEESYTTKKFSLFRQCNNYVFAFHLNESVEVFNPFALVTISENAWRNNRRIVNTRFLPSHEESEMGQFWTVRLKNQLFGPKQVSYTPLGASGPFLTLEGHFSVKIGNFWFLGLSGTQNFK